MRSLKPQPQTGGPFSAVSKFLRPLTIESEDLRHLDALRFIASLGVIILHFRGRLWVPGGWDVERLAPFALFVDLFFVVSGIVISFAYADRIKGARDYAKFLIRRLARLAPLHWLTLAFYVLVSLLPVLAGASLINPARYDSGCLPANAFLLHAVLGCHRGSYNFVSWSISAELCLYVMFPLFLMTSRANKWLPFVISLAMILALSVTFHGQNGGRPWWTWSYSGGATRAIPAFLIGVGLYRNRDLLAKMPAAYTLMLVCLLAFIIGCFAGLSKPILLPLIYAIPMFAYAADLKGVASKSIRGLAPLGQLTYSSYMIHPVVQTLFITVVFDRFLHLTGPMKTLGVVSAIAMVFLLSYFSLNLFERPSRMWIGKLANLLDRGAVRGTDRHGDAKSASAASVVSTASPAAAAKEEAST